MMLVQLALAQADALAWNSSLLNQVPPDYQGYLTNPHAVNTVCHHANRLVIAKATAVTTSMTPPSAGPYSNAVSHVTFSVLRQVNVGPQVNAFTMDYPGGYINGVVIQTSGFPVVKVGTTLVLSLDYGNGNFSSQPDFVVPVAEIPAGTNLPTNAAINAAYSEVCNAG